MRQSYRGHCFCGEVEVEVTGEPFLMGLCHCTSCRTWLGAPVNGFSLWQPEAVKVVKGADKLGVFKKTERSHRSFCRSCGGHVLSLHPDAGFTDVLAAILIDFPFAPTMHVHYGEKMLAIRDGLPKFKDLPAEFGGTGDTLPE